MDNEDLSESVEKQVKEINLYKKETSEKPFFRKVFLFRHGEVSMIIYADSMSDAALWLEKNQYMKSDSFTSGTVLFQLQDDPLWWYLTDEKDPHDRFYHVLKVENHMAELEQDQLDQDLGSGIACSNWNKVDNKLKQCIKGFLKWIE